MDTYFTYRAIESQRSSGYKNTTYALAELVDNSFDAEANECKVIFIEKRNSDNKKYIDEIIVTDDGDGMDGDILADCLKFGGGVHTDIDEIVSKNKMGKFGFGLPNASLSQCQNIRVYSWLEEGKVRNMRLVMSELRAQESIEIPELGDEPLPSYYEKVGAKINSKHGTIVSWKEFDRLSNTKSETIISHSEPLLGTLYRHLISNGKKITLASYEYSKNGGGTYTETKSCTVKPNDPLFLMSNTVISSALFKESQNPNGKAPERDPAEYYKKFVKDENTCGPTNIKIDDQSFDFGFKWQGNDYIFKITTTRAHDDIQKPGIREGANTNVGKFYKKHERECISFVRASREISADHYGFYNTADPRQRWWSIEVSFDANADDLLGVHNNKQGIEFVYTNEIDPTLVFDPYTATLQEAREQLWHELTNKLVRARKEAWKQILDCHNRFQEKGSGRGEGDPSPLPGSTPTTITATKETDGERPSQFSKQDRDMLRSRLCEKYPDIKTTDIDRAVSLYDKAFLRGCLLYAPSESEKLWSFTNVGDFLIVLVNVNHLFFQKMIGPLQEAGHESALSAVELFLSSLAWEEYEHFSNEGPSKIIEEFRAYVGLHLNRYLSEFEFHAEFSDEK